MKKLLFFSVLLLCTTHCKDLDDGDLSAIDCTEIACTEQFVTLTVSVKDGLGTPVALEAIEVTDKETSEVITIAMSASTWQMARDSGQYPLYDDSFVSGNLNTERAIIFKGFINDELVAEVEYGVETDCCHVALAVGNADIIVN